MSARIPVSTYRVQLNRAFTFKDARRLTPYLHDLGITDFYASPYLKARPESTHGYDILDHNALNPSIGSDDDYEAFVGALHGRGMGQIVDVVPNHMGIGEGTNAWWMDVLENGPASIYASYFDIDWRPVKPELAGKVLLPILGDQYGAVLENGELKLEFRDGAFRLRYYQHVLPIAPRTYADILRGPAERLAARLGPDDERLLELRSILTAIGYLPSREDMDPDLMEERNREKEVIKRRLATLARTSSAVRREIEVELRRVNGRPDDPRSFDALDDILQQQAYRLSFWRVAAEQINYRRFFDINDLAAIRMEDPRVFEETHRLILRLVDEGKVTGLRIDHPDGLWDPEEYFRRLQAAAGLGVEGLVSPNSQPPTPNPQHLYVVVEKILAKDEPLPDEWPVHGTTGYEFLNAVGGIFVDAAHRRQFDDLYARFIGQRLDFHDLVYQSKRLIMRVSLASEINVLATHLNRLAERDRRTRDFTLNALREAVREVIACFPVYRTYITGAPVSDRDRAHVEIAIAWARRRNPAVEASVFQFLRDTLLLEGREWRVESGDLEREFTRHPPLSTLHFVMKFQQTTGPVMAKAVEDTAFYIYNRLVALNEVGGEPEPFGVSVPAFHRQNLDRLRHWPHSLLCTSTHDTKRSEDVRARIAVLSEIPREWSSAVGRWSRLNRRKRRQLDQQPAPSANDEYLLYQVLLGAWPLEGVGSRGNETPTPNPHLPPPDFVSRIQQYMAKATKEAKVHTSWVNPNEAYDAAIAEFVEAILDLGKSGQFLEDFLVLQRKVAYFGAINSLSQTLLKLTSPGVPDIYQGTELWDLSLVDPDNRRPVDYRLRAQLLKELKREVGAARAAPRQSFARSLLDHWHDGRIKLYLTRRTLTFRRDHPSLFQCGNYAPLEITGRLREHVCAFVREHAGERVVVAVPRLLTRIVSYPDAHPIGSDTWGDTALMIPPRRGGPVCPPSVAAAEGGHTGPPLRRSASRYRNLFTGETLEPESGGSDETATLPVARLFAGFPVALLHQEAP